MTHGTYTTEDAFLAAIADTYDAADAAEMVLPLVARWHARGDGAAVYQNHDLGHPEVGHVKITSYGSPAAQLEVPEAELPERLPDGLPAGAINWRYTLIGVYPAK